MFMRTEATPTPSTCEGLPGQPAIGEGTANFLTRQPISATRTQSAYAMISAQDGDGYQARGGARNAPKGYSAALWSRDAGWSR